MPGTHGTAGYSALVAVLRRMEADGVPPAEMAARVRRRPGTVRRLLDHDERVGESLGSDDVLRPVERVVLDGLEAGDNCGMIASRIGRSGRQTRRIAAYARFKLHGGPLVIDGQD
jgi:hypothetical protein